MLLALPGSLCAVAAFWPLEFLLMLVMDTRASSKAKMGSKAIDDSSSHQNGKHLQVRTKELQRPRGGTSRRDAALFLRW